MAEEAIDTTECDTYGHAWYETTNQGRLRPEYGIPLVLRCERCSRMRLDVIHPLTGQLISRRYVAPFGYVRYKKGERPTKSEFRLLLLKTHESRHKAAAG